MADFHTCDVGNRVEGTRRILSEDDPRVAQTVAFLVQFCFGCGEATRDQRDHAEQYPQPGRPLIGCPYEMQRPKFHAHCPGGESARRWLDIPLELPRPGREPV